MAYTNVIRSFPRLWSLEGGLVMVVTDLHGDWEAYRRYRDRFVDLQATGRADVLVFTGDLIHAEDPQEPDKSVDIALDIINLQARYGQAVLYLLGNHELPHLYGITLAKGNRIYTPGFEAMLSRSTRRAEIIALFDSLPFYIRTRGGVALAHVGAAAPWANPVQAEALFTWSHQDLLAWATGVMGKENVEELRNGYASMSGDTYADLAAYYLAVSGPADPRYDDLLRGFVISNHPTFNGVLWQSFFNRCEQTYGQADYAIFLAAMLQEMGRDFYPQRIMVAGHMPVKGGHQIIARQHLRLASAQHASPPHAGQYLLFDAARPVVSINDLLPGLGSVYR